MKVIISGGTGLIGSALAQSLVSDGHEVVVLTRNPDRKVKGLPASVRLVGWDSDTAEGWVSEAEGADALVNLAGEPITPQAGLWTDERKRRIMESREEAGRAMVDAVRRTTDRPKVLIQASAVGYYGTHDDEIITESSPPGTDFLAEVSRRWEAASEPVEALGVRRVVARTGVVLDNGGGALSLMVLPFKMFVGGPVGSGKQYLPWIHIDDEVGALRFLIEHEGASGPYNLSAPNPVTNREFATTVGKVLGRPSFFPTPELALKIPLGEAATVVLDGQRAVPTRLQEAGYDYRFPNLEGALRDLLK